jgi:hypothetical protein
MVDETEVAGHVGGGGEWLETLRIFGIGKVDGKRIIGRLGYTLLNEHEKLFGSYWRHTFGPFSSLSQLRGETYRSVPPRSPPGRSEMRGCYNIGDSQC